MLLLASPLMRGGNRHAVLIVLEAIALLVLAGLLARTGAGESRTAHRADAVAQWLLLLSPVLLALVYLTPLPIDWWAALPGRALYLQALAEAGVVPPSWMPLSLVPDATWTSLLAGMPLVAAFLLGRHCTTGQLRLLAGGVVLIAFGEVLFGLLQISGGTLSPLYFGAGGGRPIGTFANSNHFANYLAAALVLYLWLAWSSLTRDAEGHRLTRGDHARGRQLLALWAAGGVILVLGILMSRSRGAAVTGLPAAAIGLAWLMTRGARGRHRKRHVAAMLAALLLAAIAFLGVDAVIARFTAAELSSSATFRGVLTDTTLTGAAEFWPWGAGWGVFGAVYPRFQPPSIPGMAGYAHQDYAQMLFEGGVFALVFVAAFGWLAVRRAITLARLASPRREIRRGTVAAVLSGLGLAGFLLHSLVEFNMHIPANAILASLLAGIYLRPLSPESPSP